MMSKLIVICGGTGTGKTTYAKNLIKKVGNKHLIMDINNEYNGCVVYNPQKNIEEFLIFVNNNITNTLVVIDEATIYFNSRGFNKLLNKLLTLKRHTKNNYVLIFHGITEIPFTIKNRIDILILFKTNDNFNEVVKKFGRTHFLVDYFAEVKRNKDKHFNKIIEFSKG